MINYYYNLNIVIALWFDELLFVQFILLQIFVPQTVAAETVFPYVTGKWRILNYE
jgi:hypothetical protein